MDTSILQSFRLAAIEQNLGVYGIHVHQKGHEDIIHHFRSDERVNLYSASKTFTSVAIGICKDQGRLELSDKVLAILPEYKSVASPGSEAISLKNLLQMASGKEEFWFSVDENQYTDWAQLFFQDPQKRPPGEAFFYSNACTYMLGRVVEKLTGQSVRDFLMPHLFAPLHIFNPQWHTCPQGHTIAATGLYLTTVELATLGQLLLQQGEYENRQIVSKGYVEDLSHDTISTERWIDNESAQGYGYQVWRCSMVEAYRADGKYGQFSIVLPAQEAVVTVTAHNEIRANDIVRAVFKEIVPKL